MDDFKEYILDRHDNHCNHKYEQRDSWCELPYSFHLLATEKIATDFMQSVFEGEDLYNGLKGVKGEATLSTIIKQVAIAHDCLEDARMNVSDLKNALIRNGRNTNFVNTPEYRDFVVDCCYKLTDDKGMNRKQRKNEAWWSQLLKNDVASYVKICDRLANVLYSRLTNTEKFNMYKRENSEFVSHFKSEKFSPILNKLNKQF